MDSFILHKLLSQRILILDGAMGDISWLAAGDAPMVAFHVVGDPFAPYGNGPVIVPTTGDFVVNVSGSSVVIAKADSLGNNNCFIPNNFNDVYTQHANAVNGGKEGLYPLYTTMSNLAYRQQKIQEKRKQTPWRDFVMEIASWYPIVFGKSY